MEDAKREPGAASPRRLARALLAGYAVFLVYGSLFPFAFSSDPARLRRKLYEALHPFAAEGISGFDLLSNVFLGAPVGVLIVAAGLGGTTLWSAVVRAALFQTALAVITEAGQISAMWRDPSTADVAAQVFGAVWGSLVASAFAWSRLRMDLGRWARERPSLPFLLALGSALALHALFPYVLTLDPSTVWSSLKAARSTPFDTLHGEHPVAIALYRVLPYTALAALVAVALFRSVGFRARVSAWALASSFAAILECAKLFILGRDPRLDRALLATVGSAVGVVALPSWTALARVREVAWFRVLAAGALAYVMARELLPLDLVLSPKLWATNLRHIEWIPFASYLRTNYLNGALDIGTKIVLGGWLAFAWRGLDRDTPVLDVCALIIVLELLQIFERSHVPSITDVITFGAGALAGVWMHARYRTLCAGSARAGATSAGATNAGGASASSHPPGQV